MTLSLTAVFIPLLFLGGIVGRLFREFAVVIATSILVSGVVSLTFTPMLSSRFLRAAAGREARSRSTRSPSARTIGCSTSTAGRSTGRCAIAPSRWCSRRSCSPATVVVFKAMPTGFIPDQDIGQINITTEAAQGTSYDDMVRRQQSVADIVQRDTNVQALMSVVGGIGGSSATNTGRIVSRAQAARQAHIGDGHHERAAAASWRGCPGIASYMSLPPAIQIGGRVSKGAVSVHDAGVGRRRALSGRAEADRRRVDSHRCCRTSRATCRTTTRK